MGITSFTGGVPHAGNTTQPRPSWQGRASGVPSIVKGHNQIMTRQEWEHVYRLPRHHRHATVAAITTTRATAAVPHSL